MGILDNIQGLLGANMEDPRTAATLQLAMGLLGGQGGGMQRLAGGMQGYGGVMAQARQQDEQRKRAEMQQQMQQEQLNQMRAAAQEREAEAQRAQQMAQRQAAFQQALGGQGTTPQQAMMNGQGPTQANAAQIGAQQPTNWAGLARQFPDQIKLIKDLSESQNFGRPKVARTIDGIVNGLPATIQKDEFGGNVGEAVPQWKEDKTIDFGNAIYARDPVTGALKKMGDKSQDPNSVASNVLTRRGQDMTNARAREAAAVKDDPPLKPLPPAAMKMQQVALDAIGISSSINADLGAMRKQIADGKLSFGPVSNLVSTGRNMAGMSNDESRNLSTFKSSLERLRNESLRLNIGVQTDGDAQRAWAELFQNITDTKLVDQRLREIQAINKRAVELQRLKVDSVRSNYGYGPIDSSAYRAQPAAVGEQASPKATRRWNPATGTFESVN